MLESDLGVDKEPAGTPGAETPRADARQEPPRKEPWSLMVARGSPSTRLPTVLLAIPREARGRETDPLLDNQMLSVSAGTQILS